MNLLAYQVPFLFLLLLLPTQITCDFNPNERDYYRLLGIDRSADNREIRKAFKKLALTLHPDKNVDDPQAHENFLKINRAYEVLKDEQLRNIYNTQGEAGLNEPDLGYSRGRHYQNWNYYYESFGIYDNDEEIVTLSWSDFEQSIRGSSGGNLQHQFLWFINFYSPQCSHCHHLAPEWRKMAKQLSAVVRIGAVNCAEDRPLCQQEGIRSYPSLVLYPAKIRFEGQRTAEQLVEFVVRNLNIKEQRYNDVNSERLLEKLRQPEKHLLDQYLLIACYTDRPCLPQTVVQMLTYKVQNLMQVVNLACTADHQQICEHFGLHEPKVALYTNIYENARNYFEIASGDEELLQIQPAELFQKIMNKFPKVPTASAKQLKLLTQCLYSPDTTVQSQCSAELNPGWALAVFDEQSNHLAEDTGLIIELKALSSFMRQNGVYKVVCSRSTEEESASPAQELCKQLNLRKYPSIVAVKADLASEYTSVETYYGRLNAIDILNFAHESFLSKLRTLTEGEFEQSVASSREPAVVQFFAPWCPACKTAKQTLRKVSQHHFNAKVFFGVVDCAVYANLCRQYNIHSYPSVLLYNDTIPYQYFGKYQEEDELLDFIENTIESHVLELDPSTFTTLVQGRRSSEVWAVDYYSPYCQPCQVLGPIWRKLANLMTREEPKLLRLGALNCAKYKHFCGQVNVNAYPTLRVYPALDDEKHGQSFYRFNEHRRDIYILRAWLYDFLPASQSVTEITSGSQFEELVTSSKATPTLVTFYAPWAFSSRKYAPDFIQLAKNLSEVKCLRLNCQRFSALCERARVEYYPTVRLYTGSAGGHPRSHWSGIHIQFPGNSADDLTAEIRSLLASADRTVMKDEL